MRSAKCASVLEYGLLTLQRDWPEINSALGGGFFDGFIPKPVTTATLKAKLDELYAAQ